MRRVGRSKLAPLTAEGSSALPIQPPLKDLSGRGVRGFDLGRKGALSKPNITITIPNAESAASATSASKALAGAATTPRTSRTPQVAHFAQHTAASLRRTNSVYGLRDAPSTPTMPKTAATVGRGTKKSLRSQMTPSLGMPPQDWSLEPRHSDAAKRSASRMSKEEPKKPRRGDGDGEDDLTGLTRRISGLSTREQPNRVSRNIAFVERLMRANRNAPSQDREQFEDLLDLLRHLPGQGAPRR